jgi:hypothetical protein
LAIRFLPAYWATGQGVATLCQKTASTHNTSFVAIRSLHLGFGGINGLAALLRTGKVMSSVTMLKVENYTTTRLTLSAIHSELPILGCAVSAAWHHRN